MKESDEYDAQALPVSGPFAGLDPEQLPVIVDKHGEKVKDDPGEVFAMTDGPSIAMPSISGAPLVEALAQLCSTHVVQIEYGAAKALPVHRIVLGFGEQTFAEQLAQSLDAALAHHAKA